MKQPFPLKIWSNPIETTIYRQMFQVPGSWSRQWKPPPHQTSRITPKEMTPEYMVVQLGEDPRTVGEKNGFQEICWSKTGGDLWWGTFIFFQKQKKVDSWFIVVMSWWLCFHVSHFWFEMHTLSFIILIIIQHHHPYHYSSSSSSSPSSGFHVSSVICHSCNSWDR